MHYQTNQRKLETDEYLMCRNKASHGVMFRHKDSSSALTGLHCGSSLSSAVKVGCFLQEADHIALQFSKILEYDSLEGCDLGIYLWSDHGRITRP